MAFAYDQDHVDKCLEKFEKAADKQIANKGSMVRLKAAERDLLKDAEAARNLLLAAVKGDKEKLKEVFGGHTGNERFYRFRGVLEKVELSSHDDRWDHLKEAIEIIEEVLKTLGLFQALQAAMNAPKELVYRGAKKRYGGGEKVALMPEWEGGEITEFTLSEELPEGLIFSKTSGKITGTVKLGIEVPKKEYVITAKNADGQDTFSFDLMVGPPPPSSLEYNGIPIRVFPIETYDWPPTYAGGPVKEWAIEPALPTGMWIDQGTGHVRGRPAQETKPETEYKVTAKNFSGEVSAPVKFAVVIPKPQSLDYPGNKIQYPYGSAMYLLPDLRFETNQARSEVTASQQLWRRARMTMLAKLEAKAVPGCHYSIEPPLENGLCIVVKTGVITGLPEGPMPKKTYHVTVKNESGEASCDVPLEILVIPPKNLSYSDIGDVLYTGEPLSFVPDIDGIATKYEVSPELPTGLHLDPETGDIRGNMPETRPKQEYVVTASNSEGSTSCPLNFAVQRPPPESLDYPEYPRETKQAAYLKPLEWPPTVEGEVDEYSIEPELPKGMQMDPKTGIITGKPEEVVEEKPYKVTAKNESGATSCDIPFAVVVMPPEELVYPGIDDEYTVGEPVSAKPEVIGGPTVWESDKPLPKGLELAPDGAIIGTPEEVTPEDTYVITASNDAGGTSVVLTFGITEPPPQNLTYPDATPTIIIDQEDPIEWPPHLDVGTCNHYEIEPALPPGLQIDEATGVISGMAEEEAEMQTYKVTGRNTKGECSCEVEFEAITARSASGVDQKFATLVEGILDVAELMKVDPGRDKNLANWMIWMVHRAYLDDPSLIDFSFANLQMPLPHLEPRIAPKLCSCLGKNTHIESFIMTRSNLQKPSGPDLAKSMRENKSIKMFDISLNALDASCIKGICDALQANEENVIECWRFGDQLNAGQYMGRPVEEAVANLVQSQSHILKVGLAVQDAHWRMVINNSLTRNGDAARRKRKGRPDEVAKMEVKSKAMPFVKITLNQVPDKALWEVFDEDNKKLAVVSSFVNDKKVLPTKEQLQTHARAQGSPLPFSAVAPLLREWRQKLLDACQATEWTITDAYSKAYTGTVKTWSEKNERWELDFWEPDGTRYKCTKDKAFILEVSDQMAAWLKKAD